MKLDKSSIPPVSVITPTPAGIAAAAAVSIASITATSIASSASLTAATTISTAAATIASSATSLTATSAISAATTIASTTSLAATAVTSTPSSTSAARLGLVDGDVTSVKVTAVHLFNRLPHGALVLEGDESKSSRSARIAIIDDLIQQKTETIGIRTSQI
ncbi:unnamed protein product [Cuscuta campestris]|uniref:Uncharacterized protein n=1 Tax=Cuscuta campestris TaxID=132261 RepID=A0A484KRA5_9ASTE|nr:unnamed protein product [Cuscuta campestris]